jgi:hypothetical protein
MKDFVDEKAKFVLAKKKRLLAILPMVLYETMLKQQLIITIIKFCTLVKNLKKMFILEGKRSVYHEIEKNNGTTTVHINNTIQSSYNEIGYDDKLVILNRLFNSSNSLEYMPGLDIY